ncbi:MAG: helix-turn-helix domain-containing GNAT family N-acetyltransferase [Brevundimonas sp.]|nr:helix-turn-helix domain-containing GNAT family N-acetyltransferase [Brevundimonas sp.]
MDAVQAVRGFNRFYTRRIGLLEDHLPSSSLSLPEGRIVYELATGETPTAAGLSRELDMDKAQLSRLLTKLVDKGLVETREDPGHGRRKILSLTAAGRSAFAEMDEGTHATTGAMLTRLHPSQVDELVGAMDRIQTALRPDAAAAPVVLRNPVPGDIGWVIHRQAALYAQEYGWDWTYEGLISKILGDFVVDFDPEREAAWIAGQNGRTVGSIFLMRGDTPDTGRLRLLYVEPVARGTGLGRRLVDACIAGARERGYRKLTLWTNDVLTSARRIYQATGFRLVEENRHRSFGHDLTGQTWVLDL